MELELPQEDVSARRMWNGAPSFREVLLLAIATALVFVTTILYFRDYQSTVSAFGDSGDYISVSAAIKNWSFSGLQIKQFWGYPYAMAVFSKVTHTSVQTSLLMVSCLCSFLSVALAFRLWGGWVAGLFAVVNFDWMQRSYLGGSEPLFVVLLFAAFWAVRRGRWITACCLASCATVTRPVGIFALFAIGIVLLMRREYAKLLLSTGAALAIGGLYLVPFWIYFGDPLYEFHRYQTADWHSGSPITWPFAVIVRSFIWNREPWTNVVLTLLWIVVVLLGLIAMARPDFRDRLREYPAEFAFAAFYICFLFSYNSAEWARAEFVRFAIPVLPLVLLALSRWIPKDRRILWSMAIVTPVFAAASALGIRNVIHMLRA